MFTLIVEQVLQACWGLLVIMLPGGFAVVTLAAGPLPTSNSSASISLAPIVAKSTAKVKCRDDRDILEAVGKKRETHTNML